MIVVNGVRIYDRFDDDHPETPKLCDPQSLEEFGFLERDIGEKSPDTLLGNLLWLEELFEGSNWKILWGHCRYKRRTCQYTIHLSKDGGETSASTSFLAPIKVTPDSPSIQYFLSLLPSIENRVCMFNDVNPEETLKAVLATQKMLARLV
jgi:hypothetical protein